MIVSREVKLYGFPGSNAWRTAQVMLEYKGIDYKSVLLPPGLHPGILLGMGFDSMTVPGLKIGRQRVQGSRWIARALDELVPERPLFPADAERRARVEEAERRGEELQDATRRIFFCSARRDRSLFPAHLGRDRSRPMRMYIRASAGVNLRLAIGFHRASDEVGREEVARLPARLDQIDAWIDEGLIGGAELNAADFQIGVSFSGLSKMEDLAPLVEGRRAAILAQRVAPDFGVPIGRVLPGEWIARAIDAAGPRRDARLSVAR